MRIQNKPLFILSVAILALSSLQLLIWNEVFDATITRNFNFGLPLVLLLLTMQVAAAIAGVYKSLNKKAK